MLLLYKFCSSESITSAVPDLDGGVHLCLFIFLSENAIDGDYFAIKRETLDFASMK